MIELTPSQIAALKLARDGDLYPQPANKWTHENATVTYAKTDRWKERPQKIKSVTAKTLGELKEPGFLERRHLDDDATKDVYGITMAGKMWLLKTSKLCVGAEYFHKPPSLTGYDGLISDFLGGT